MKLWRVGLTGILLLLPSYATAGEPVLSAPMPDGVVDPGPRGADAPRPPNVVLVFTDDQLQQRILEEGAVRSGGELRVVLDLTGKLDYLRVTPERVERSEEEPAPMDWPKLSPSSKGSSKEAGVSPPFSLSGNWKRRVVARPPKK